MTRFGKSELTLSNTISTLVTELNNVADDLGNVDNLTDSNVVGGLITITQTANNTSSNLGTISSLTTTDKSNLVNAINEINGKIGSTSSVELAILSGATLSTAELNILDGATLTTNELNTLDGITATVSELNILDGATITSANLNVLSGITSSTTITDLSADTTPELGGELSAGSNGITFDDTGSAFKIIAEGTDLHIYYGSTLIISIENDGTIRSTGDIEAFNSTP
jgi:hypothetical protein